MGNYFYRSAEYLNKRQQDNKKENDMRDTLRAVYYNEGLTPSYNTPKETGFDEKKVIELEKRGYDVKLISPTYGEIIADEKAFISKQNAYDFSKTYSFEVSTQNNKDGNGWLFKEDTINSHYALIYPQVKDGNIQKIEILVVKKDKILNLLKENNLDTRKKVEDYLENNGHWCNDGRRRAQLNDNIKITHSAQLPESPVNVIINRNWLREEADVVIDNKNVPEAVRKYKEMLKMKEQEKSGIGGEKPQSEKSNIIPGIYLDKKAKEAFQSAGKNIHKLKSKTPPKFVNWNFAEQNKELSDLIGKKFNILINEYAVHNNTVILKGVADKSISENPIGIVCGMADNKRNYKNLNFKQLSQKQQFVLQGEFALMKDNEIIRKNERIQEKEIERL